ncbi:hypothetical protein [[Leptolyngbya] sp. PCC 7376]|uniref:hypothetical protein n=1 Tax=[Leptolyngbya] sp. PCC 7376 TaxID=111781 RepID=UPI0002D4184E|nr:hypothetical protein [[Leptolyngbya] sp. PCC 7376]
MQNYKSGAIALIGAIRDFVAIRTVSAVMRVNLGKESLRSAPALSTLFHWAVGEKFFS